MQRSAKQRSVAIILAVFAQGSLVALYILPRLREMPVATDSPRLVFIQPIEGPRVAPSRRNDASPTRLRIAPARQDLEPVNSREPAPDAPPAVTQPPQTPRINWQEAIALALQDDARTIPAEEGDNPLDSRPKAMEMPESGPQQPGLRMDRLPSGDIITRHRLTENVEMVCEHLQKPLSALFDASWHRLPMCSTYRIRTGLEGIDKLKPRYLSRPLPKPALPGNAAGSAAVTDAPP